MDLTKGVLFRSAVSGLFYKSHKAAGDIDQVRVDGKLYLLHTPPLVEIKDPPKPSWPCHERKPCVCDGEKEQPFEAESAFGLQIWGIVGFV